MNVNEFAKMISKHNEKDKRWSIICFITFIFTGFVGVDETTVLGKICFPLCGSIMIIFFTMHFLKKYLSIMLYMGIDTATENEYLYNIAKTQAFPVKKYFDFLRKKLVVWQIVFFIITSVIFILHTNYIGILIAVVMALIPSVVCLVYEKRFNKEICTRNKNWEAFVGGCLIGITSLVEICISFVYLFLGYMMVWAITSDNLLGGLNENVILYRSYENEKTFGIMLFSFLIFVFACMYPLKSKFKVIRIILGIIVIGFGVVDAVMENNMYTEIYEDKIIVSNFDRTKEYSLSEIESFKVYEDDEELQVKVTFKDGFSETLFGSVATNTEAFDEKYYSIYNFMEEMLPIYMENGAKGEIDKEDMEKLREIIKGYDKEIREAFEGIVELMS